MNTALSWIKAYVPELDCTAQEYADAMTLTGTKVETYEKLDKNLEKIVIGQIEKIEKHPDADKLIVCQVNIGTEVIQIVTGAQNVKEGDLVPVALDGSVLPGGKEIHAGKLRGEDSNGMLCSFAELGLEQRDFPSAYENGIWILSDDPELIGLTVGEDIRRAVGLDDHVVEF